MNNLAKSAIGLMLATLIGKILGFVREMVLMYSYGTSSYSDVYITAMNIPIVVFAVIGSALATTFIPLYHESLEKRGEEGALKFTNNIIVIVTLITFILSVIGYVFTQPLVKLFAMNFTGEKLILTVEFVRVMIIGLVFIGISNILTSYLQIKGNFIVPGMVAVPNNVVLIVSIILSYTLGNIYILPVGALMGMISQLIFQFPFAIKHGLKFNPCLNFKDEYFKKMVILVCPVLIGVAINQVNTMVDRSLASGLGDGIIAALNSANRLNWFVMGLFIVTLSSIIYPTLSKFSSENEFEKFKESVKVSINIVILIIVPVTVGSIIFATPIVQILFERGAFNENSTEITSAALVYYSIGMIGLGLRNVLDRIFYSLKDTKTPMINGVISMILNIILNVILVKFMGYKGLALATSLSFLICTFLLMINLGKKIGYYEQDKIALLFIKSLTASILMGITVKLIYSVLIGIVDIGILVQIISLSSLVLIGVLIYSTIIYILKVKEVNIITNIIKSKIKRR
ncbi:murein biosynthesis integral membrane protein MurJ [Paraclostridium ghonii]|uniref:murein biosynthesis integral membrane protein MurJ n=1 Tax=Paraclostridium ghonii TaxID=29358 RepID=UPI00202CCB07|nr:murein biosynthesis integral membrane protein MurJ [Paeniclostridium ghonii]MCM0166427.1 murein biosynthesis integral membrane protein MurJ [Paeniclostridium ghonii]